jgi:hypothetical protein
MLLADFGGSQHILATILHTSITDEKGKRAVISLPDTVSPTKGGDIEMRNATTNILEGLHGEEVLVRRDTSLPETVKTEDQLGLGEWNLVSGLNPKQFDKELYKAGWQFFYIPPETRASAVGFNRKQALERALKKLLAKAHAAKLNAVQLTGVEANLSVGFSPTQSSWVFITRASAHTSVTFRRVWSCLRHRKRQKNAGCRAPRSGLRPSGPPNLHMR